MGDGEGDGNRHNDPVGRRRSTTAAPATAADIPHRRPPRPGLAHAEDTGEDEEEEEEVAEAGERGTDERAPPPTRPRESVARPSRGDLHGGARGGLADNDRQGRHRDVERVSDRGRIVRAWGDPDGGGEAAMVPAVVGGQRQFEARGGVEGRVAQVGGGGSTDSSEESRNSYYPYDQGQLEVRGVHAL